MRLLIFSPTSTARVPWPDHHSIPILLERAQAAPSPSQLLSRMLASIEQNRKLLYLLAAPKVGMEDDPIERSSSDNGQARRVCLA